MKQSILAFALLLPALPAAAQGQADPVLMTVNGKSVTRSEFEYSYNKNGNVEGAVEKKTVEEYVPMYVNYKLKVAAAEAARLDTLTSFREEFRTYRDMQLTPYMVDTAYIDSVARGMYDATLKRLDGHDLIRPAHILIAVKQSATEKEKAAAKATADSICTALRGGADFADLAKRLSADKGSGANGGQLPLLGPGSTVKEFEDAAYALKAGETSEPVLSPFGYHVIRMTERHPLAPYTEVKSDIVAQLKRYRNIDEASAEHRISQMVAQSGGKLTREAVLDSVMQAHIATDASLRYLIQEYHDGLLLYEVSKRQVWDVAAADSAGQERWYKAHKKQYAWDEPRFKGYIYQCKDAKLDKRVAKVLKKTTEDTWRKDIKQAFNKDSVTVTVTGPYLCKPGENPYIDRYAFKKADSKAEPHKGYATANVCGKVMKQPASYLDVRPQVLADYQADMEKKWVDALHTRFAYTVDETVLPTVNNH